MPRAFRRKDHGSKGFTVPTDDYIAKIVDSDYLPNKNKNGHYLKLEFELQNKKVKGRKLRVFLNLDHPNESAVEMANDELGSICDAVGKELVKDSKELHGKLMILKVREVPPEGSNAAQNVIDMYLPIEDQEEDEELEEEDMVEEEDEDEEIEEEEEEEKETPAQKKKRLAAEKKAKEQEEEDEDENEDDDGEEEINADSVKKLARDYKNQTSLIKLKKILEEYEIEKISEISELGEDDLESLYEDLEEELE